MLTRSWDNCKDSSKQITKVTNSSLLVGQTASGPPSYIQVRHAGADFQGPGAQKHQFKDQKPKKQVILSPLSDLLQTLQNVLLLPSSTVHSFLIHLVSNSPRF